MKLSSISLNSSVKSRSRKARAGCGDDSISETNMTFAIGKKRKIARSFSAKNKIKEQ